MKKTYILDTNVLLTDSNSLFGFEEHDIVLPLIVLEELDRHKDRQDEVGRNAREVVRTLANITKGQKDFVAGISLGKNLGMLKIMSMDDLVAGKDAYSSGYCSKNLPSELEGKKTGDNIIAQFCLNYADLHSTETVILVTRDTVLRLKGQTLGITCESYRKYNVAASSNLLYSGVKVIEDREDVPVDKFYAKELTLPEDIENTLYPNEFVVLKSGQQSAVARYMNKGAVLRELSKQPGKLIPRNKEQEFARELLFDQDVKLVTLAGKSGTGKTLLSIDAGIEQVLHAKKYRSLVICRPVMPVGKDIGFLPGDISEKLEPWLAPIKDNLRFLLGTGLAATSRKGSSKFDEQILQDYFENGTIEVQALAFIRGRSIANAFIIIDEAQNTNLHEIKTILTRAGENTKIVLTGDLEQIDSSYVDSVSNGLSIAIEKFKGQKMFGHVTFVKGERSALATLASSIL